MFRTISELLLAPLTLMDVGVNSESCQYRYVRVSLKLKSFLCGLVVRVPGYRSRGPGAILGATRFSEKY
jgi:hypothetical protein